MSPSPSPSLRAEEEKESPRSTTARKRPWETVRSSSGGGGGGSGGLVAILDLPAGTRLSLDGGRAEIVRRDDFVGFSHLSSGGRLHLLTHRRGVDGDGIALTVGLVALRGNDDDDGDEEEEWTLVRRYDPRTEEPSPRDDDVDDVTRTNLRRAVDAGELVGRVVPHDRCCDEEARRRWRALTDRVDAVALRRRGLYHGVKVVPGHREEDTEDNDDEETDGARAAWPPIPCVDRTEPRLCARHRSTARWLERLTPAERTATLLGDEDDDDNDDNGGGGAGVLSSLISSYYGGDRWRLLADVQLSFVLFLHLGCPASLEHWRDMVSMLSLEGRREVVAHADLYAALLDVLVVQLESIEEGFFEEVEYSEGNFFVPALRRLRDVCSRARSNDLMIRAKGLVTLARERFGVVLDDDDDAEGHGRDDDDDDGPVVVSLEELEASSFPSSAEEFSVGARPRRYETENDDDDDDDDVGPVVVPLEEVEASRERWSAAASRRRDATVVVSYPQSVRDAYPLLFAAVCPHEDVLMACARILDDEVDASLVREAAAYLENVEARP